ncbi:MAG: iron-containing alcohol dehydrogenase [Clostridia bacterium]|nr:iron-containing alcohol dehydrogenase [Clostridia bacterium]
MYRNNKVYCRVFQFCLRIGSLFLDWSQPELVTGEDSVLKISDILKSNNKKSVLIVTDNGLKSLGLIDGLVEKLENDGIKVSVFSDVQPNPTISNVENAKDFYFENGCEAIIAFGGGSPMDCAKGAGARISNPDRSINSMRGLFHVRKRPPLLIAVPTTAGTGSETTIAAVITDEKTHEKSAMNSAKIRPLYAALYPKLTTGLPQKITSTTGLDALTHAVEAYIGGSNTRDTRKKAEDAVKLIFENLETAYNDGKNIEARNNMLLGSFYAGVAFTKAYVGYVHCIAHQLGGIYGVPHGLANAVILPYVLEFYGKKAYKRLAKLADIAGIGKNLKTKEEKAKAFISEIKAMERRMEIPEKFEQIKEEDISTIVERALKEGNPLYPVPVIMSPEDCEKVVRQLMV